MTQLTNANGNIAEQCIVMHAEGDYFKHTL